MGTNLRFCNQLYLPYYQNLREVNSLNNQYSPGAQSCHGGVPENEFYCFFLKKISAIEMAINRTTGCNVSVLVYLM